MMSSGDPASEADPVELVVQRRRIVEAEDAVVGAPTK
jgi:hypothetical protein